MTVGLNVVKFTAMLKLAVQKFGVSLDARFPTPVAFPDAKVHEFSSAMIRLFGITSEQFKLRHSDILFGYELKASFYNGAALLERNADRLVLSFNDATTAAHRDFIVPLLEKYWGGIAKEIDPRGNFSVSLHASFQSEAEFTEFFKPSCRGDGVISEGRIGVLRVATWPEEVRLSIERSVLYPHSMFVYCSSTIGIGSEPSPVSGICRMIGESATAFGIELTLS